MKNQLATFQIDLTATPIKRTLPTGIARIYGVECFQIGEPNGWVITPAVVAPAVPKWEGVEVMMDHAGLFDNPSTRNLVGMIRNPTFNGSIVAGELHVLNLKQSEPAIELLDLILSMKAQGQTPPRVGMSTDMYLSWEERTDKRFVTSIDQVSTTDIVVHPAAGGRIDRVIMQDQGGNTMKIKCQKCSVEYDEGTEHKCAAPAPAPAKPQQSPAQFANYSNALAQAEADATGQLQEQCTRLLELKLSASGLPATMCDLVRAHFQEGDKVRVYQPAELDAEIERTKTAHTQMSATNAIVNMGQPVQSAHRHPAVSGMWDSLDRITAAYERLMGLPVKTEFSETPRLTGIRELYVTLTGDREMRGMFNPQHAQFAVAGATTPMTAAILANITADVMNKLMLESWNQWSTAGYNWWERAFQLRDFATLQQTKWIVLGGFGDLPTVAEGAVYAEGAIDDKRENISFIKKGKYVPLTMEMIDRDDTQAWRGIGTKLGIAAIRTLSAAAAAILEANGNLNEDGNPLFDLANHNNVIGQDLDAAGWDEAGERIYNQTEYNSLRKLALWPDRVIVPVGSGVASKRRKAIELFFSTNEPGGNSNNINVARLDGTKDSDGPVIVCPDLTDADDWYALCNPELQGALGIGFRFGRRPEIFSAAGATDFLMFYQDCLPIKVRWFYAVGAIDYRGIVKSVL